MKIFLATLIAVFFLSLFSPPADFPTGQMVEIKQGGQVAEVLRERSVVRFASLFNLTARLTGNQTGLKAGRYVFAKPLPLWSVFTRIYKGEYGTHSRKVTVPEGFTNNQVGKLIGQNWNETDQGYLFPDTYYIDEFSTESEIRGEMRANFNARVGEISRNDLILASIIEEEASSTKDRQIIAGILKKRLSLDIPLQVDVAPETYKEKGLPATPITNPGLDAITAVRNLTNTKYLYYLSDKKGVIHYARTFEEHLANTKKYL